MMEKVQVYNRYTGKMETEPICGEWFLRFAYGTFFGRVLQNLFFCRPIFSRLACCYANCSRSRKKIAPFISRYGIPVEESYFPPSAFGNFNEFFSRPLRPEARPIDRDRDAIVAPADGRYFYIPRLSPKEVLKIKGKEFSLETLLRSRELVKKFLGGSAIICRLCPFDYHRFHFPCDGIPGKARCIGGKLHSVHPIALARRAVFGENKRSLTRIICTHGEVAMVEVGATFVGTIFQTFSPHKHCKKGTEKGFFSLGGSTIILLFEPQMAIACRDIGETFEKNRECYVRMGDKILTFRGGRRRAANSSWQE
jgi:phosphatidylserine decarboxylase